MAPIGQHRGETGKAGQGGRRGLCPAGMTRRLTFEFCALYLAAPVAMAVLLPATWLFPVLFAVTAAGLLLLHLTPGFDWADLTRGAGRIGWGRVALFALLTAVAAVGAATLFAPEARFGLIRQRPELMLMIAALYPLLSALPQEIVFRPLFFRRYGPILPTDARLQIALNAAVFALAHLMYWNALVAVLTFAGGLVFAHAYRVRQNFPEAVVLHAVGGILVFAAGLGVFFYSGNVVRPF